MTGYARPEDRVRALVAGFQAHLGKPVATDELFGMIVRLLGSVRDRPEEVAAG